MAPRPSPYVYVCMSVCVYVCVPYPYLLCVLAKTYHHDRSVYCVQPSLSPCVRRVRVSSACVRALCISVHICVPPSLSRIHLAVPSSPRLCECVCVCVCVHN